MESDKPPQALRAALQGLIIIAVTIALRRREVAVFVIIVLYRNVLRLLLVVGFFRRLALSASSTHVMPFSPDESAFALHADSG